MRLRGQLLLVSLLLLSLPWAGCQYLRELESALRQGQEKATATSAEAIASLISQQVQAQPEWVAALTHPDIHTPLLLPHPMVLDGYSDDWPELSDAWLPLQHQLDSGVTVGPDALLGHYLFGRHHERLYLYLRIYDDAVTYFNPTDPRPLNGDHLRLTGPDQQEWAVATSAPGRVRSFLHSQYPPWQANPGLEGFWVDQGDGYSIELELPASWNNGLIRLSLWHETPAKSLHIRGTAGARLATDIDLLNASVRSLLPDNAELLLAAGNGMRLGQLVPMAPAATPADATEATTPSLWRVLQQRLYRAILEQRDQPVPWRTGPNRLHWDATQFDPGNAFTRWSRAPASGAADVYAWVPLPLDDQHGLYLLLRQSSEAILSLTDQVTSRLFAISFSIFIVAVVLTLAMAARLSWRLRRLTKATEVLQQLDGRTASIPDTGAADEIGDLARGFAALQTRLNEYTAYLKSLAAKLSHELQTPLAIVRSSLDNLAEANQEERQRYQQRAREGLDRLKQLISAMSAATHMEQSIKRAELESFDLAAMLRELGAAYQNLYPNKRVELDIPDHAASMTGAPELIAQMLDKLMNNANDFTADGDTIRLALHATPTIYRIRVVNQGPLLPQTMQHQLFDSLVSLRDKTGDATPHLGLGLYIVRLVAEFHQGHVEAANLESGEGVEFCVTLPASNG